MPVDPNISLATKQADVAPVINQAAQLDQQNALTTEQTLQAHYANMGEREKQRLQSTVVGAAQLKTYLDKGDIEGAHDFLVKRQQSLHQRMANGEEIDDQETAYALDKIRRGDIEGLANDVNALAAAGQAYGMIGGQGTPSNVQEWQYYNSLPDDKKQEYLTMKRSNQIVDLGGTKIVPNQANPSGKPAASFNVGLKPEDQPDNARNKSDAQARGAVEGTNAANAASSAKGLVGVETALKDLQTAGKSAPGGVAQNLGATVANKAGAGGAAADAQGTFTVKRAAAENAIREAFRVAGSGSQSDADALPFIQMLPNADDADSVKIAKTNAAMEAVRNRITVKLQQAKGSGAPVESQGIKVSNGQETYTIKPEDLAAAQAEGFQQVQ